MTNKLELLDRLRLSTNYNRIEYFREMSTMYGVVVLDI